MATSGQRLLALVRELLEPRQNGAAESDLAGKVRHDLRNPLNGLIGFCELWLEDAPDLLLEGFVPDLREIHALSWRLLRRGDGLGQAAGAPGRAGATPERVPRVVESLPACAAEGPEAGRAAAGAVLVVDDTEINRDLLSRRLRRDGHAVTVAEDGRRALEL